MEFFCYENCILNMLLQNDRKYYVHHENFKFKKFTFRRKTCYRYQIVEQLRNTYYLDSSKHTSFEADSMLAQDYTDVNSLMEL
jgi:hypothetical protein